MAEKKLNPKSKPAPEVPDCRVADIGLVGFAECQMAGPNQCAYAMPFGYCFLCSHPQLERMIATSKERPGLAFIS